MAGAKSIRDVTVTLSASGKEHQNSIPVLHISASSKAPVNSKSQDPQESREPDATFMTLDSGSRILDSKSWIQQPGSLDILGSRPSWQYGHSNW